MTERRRRTWPRRRAVRTIAAEVHALGSRDARQHLATLTALTEETHHDWCDANRAHNYMLSQELYTRYLWLDGKRREAAWKLKQGVTR